jgi:hypothetical protein
VCESDRNTPKNDRNTPKSDRNAPKSDRNTPKSKPDVIIRDYKKEISLKTLQVQDIEM